MNLTLSKKAFLRAAGEEQRAGRMVQHMKPCDIKDEVLHLYVDKKLTVHETWLELQQRGADFNESQLAYYIRKLGVMRPKNEVSSLMLTGRKKNYAKRCCEICLNEFKPTNQVHRWCFSCLPTNLARDRFKKYKITQAQYDMMLNQQNSCCAICKIDLKSLSSRKVSIDHCHKTGRVRGIICQGCNIKLVAVDDYEWLQNALNYVRIPN